MRKKWTASILAFLLALSILAGCGAETTSQPDISSEPSQSMEVETPDPAQDVEPDDTEEDYVSISTVHSAKGLEYRCVYLLDTSDAFYSRNERGTEEDCEDLRVLYVALTRAKEQLTIFINETAPFYAAQEQSLTHHLIYDDVLECAHTDPDIPIAGNYGTAALKFA